jgi:hypothetical protein
MYQQAMQEIPYHEINIPFQIAGAAFTLFYILFQSPIAAICGSLLVYIAITIYNETLYALIIERMNVLFHQANPPVRRSQRLAAKKLDGSAPIQYSQ